MIFFISDTSFYNQDLIEPDRGRQMRFESSILNNCELLLRPSDILYHLGNFARSIDDVQGYLTRWQNIDCQKILLKTESDNLFSDDQLGSYFDYIIHDDYISLNFEDYKVLASYFPVGTDMTYSIEKSASIKNALVYHDVLIHGYSYKYPDTLQCQCEKMGFNCFNVNVKLNKNCPIPIGTVMKFRGMN